MTEYLIIGNGVAGVTAAEKLRSQDSQSPIHIFSDEPYPFYARIRLPEIISDQVKPETLFLHKEEWYKQQGITLHLSETVEQVDPQKKTVQTSKGSYPYQRLLLAGGAHSFVPPFEGNQLKGVFTLRTMQDALNIAKESFCIDTAIMIGAGLLGLEAAHALLKMGTKAVCVTEVSNRLLPRQTDEKSAAILQKQLEAKGFTFYLGAKIKRISGQRQTTGVDLEDGRKIDGQMVLISAGVRPNMELAKSAGLNTNQGIIVDDNLRTSNPDIFAAGDIAEHKGRCYGIWPAAKEQGEIAGINLGGKNAIYRGTVPSNRLKISGIDLVASGEIDAEGKYQSRVEEAGRTYRKLVLDKDNILIGCILLGNIEGYNDLLAAIQLKKKI